MLYKISEKIVASIFDKDDENLDEYIYGLELLFCSSLCTVLMVIIGFLTNMLVESVVFMVSFSVLRVFSGGYHSNSFLICNISTLLIYGANILFYKYLFDYLVAPFVYITVFVVTVILVVLFSPVENDNNPLEKNDYAKCKIKACITAGIEISTFFLLFYFLKFESIAIMISTFLFVDILIVLELFKKRGIKYGKQ